MNSRRLDSSSQIRVPVSVQTSPQQVMSRVNISLLVFIYNYIRLFHNYASNTFIRSHTGHEPIAGLPISGSIHDYPTCG